MLFMEFIEGVDDFTEADFTNTFEPNDVVSRRMNEINIRNAELDRLSLKERKNLAMDGCSQWETYMKYKHRAIRESKTFQLGDHIEKTLLTVVGPGYKNRYGRMTFKEISVLCDPKYGGCGTEFNVPYHVLAQSPVRYSCGCKVRRRGNDHTGLTVTNRKTGRTLTILYYDEQIDLGWVYVCDCCAKTYSLPRGRGEGSGSGGSGGGTIPMKLTEAARHPCPSTLPEPLPEPLLL